MNLETWSWQILDQGWKRGRGKAKMQKWVNIYFWGYDSQFNGNTVVRIELTPLNHSKVQYRTIWLMLTYENGTRFDYSTNYFLRFGTVVTNSLIILVFSSVTVWYRYNMTCNLEYQLTIRFIQYEAVQIDRITNMIHQHTFGFYPLVLIRWIESSRIHSW